MAWFKVDDQLAFNAKVMLAGNSAMGLWVRCGSWSSAQLTGGFVPAHMANAMANECDTDALVKSGLWHEVDGGYQFHDWADFQPDAEAEKEKRKSTSLARSLAGKAGAAARWHGKDDGKDDGNAIATASQNDATAMAPTRPDPTRPSSKEDSAAKRGTRIPSNFKISSAMREWAEAEVPLVDLDKKLKEFIDYWSAVPGQKGVKLDWVGTWRNGMRKQQEFAERDAPRNQPRKVRRFNDEDD